MSSELKNPELMKFLSDYAIFAFSSSKLNLWVDSYLDDHRTERSEEELNDDVINIVSRADEIVNSRFPELDTSAHRVLAQDGLDEEVRQIVVSLMVEAEGYVELTNVLIGKIAAIQSGCETVKNDVNPQEEDKTETEQTDEIWKIDEEQAPEESEDEEKSTEESE